MKSGKLIKKYRKQRGLTQLQVAVALSYEIPQFISLVENGHSQMPLNKAKEISEALNLTKSEKQILSKQLVSEYEIKVRKAFGL